MTKSILVLDLNGTIIRRDSSSGNIVKRPYLNRFLEFACENFNVVVWTNSKKHNAYKICKYLFRENIKILCQDDCDIDPQSQKTWPTLKNMDKLRSLYPSLKIIVVDDSPEKIQNADVFFKVSPFEKFDEELITLELKLIDFYKIPKKKSSYL